jgi:uncharacterized membrane protein
MRQALGIVIVIMVALAPPAVPRTDPQTGRIRLLFVGQWPFGGRPQYLIEDPLLITSVLPYHDFGAQLEEIQRYMHQRYPRTTKHMTDSYDIVAYSNIQLLAFTGRQIQMVSESVVGEGLGYMMFGGHTSFGGTTDSYPTWKGSSIDEILPVEVVDGIYIRPIVFKLVVSDPDHALMVSLPWSDLPLFPYTLNAATMRQSGHLLAETDLDERWPVVAYGDYGNGRSVGFLTPLNTVDNYNMRNWGFFDDMCANLAYFAADTELPQDPFMVHKLRGSFRSYHDERLLYISMVEFVDRFGASTARLEDILAEVEGIRADSYSAYISQDYVTSSQIMARATEMLKAGHGQAIEVKNLALLWVYVIEWIVVAATLMIVGSVLWTLMIRKRLYREIASTRAVGRG